MHFLCIFHSVASSQRIHYNYRVALNASPHAFVGFFFCLFVGFNLKPYFCIWFNEWTTTKWTKKTTTQKTNESCIAIVPQCCFHNDEVRIIIIFNLIRFISRCNSRETTIFIFHVSFLLCARCIYIISGREYYRFIWNKTSTKMNWMKMKFKGALVIKALM